MTKNGKFLLIGGLVAAVVLGATYFGAGGGLQGKLSSSHDLVSVSVHPGSPSGSKAVNPEDQVALYELCAKGGVQLGSIGIDFISDASLDPDTFNSESYAGVRAGTALLTDGGFEIKNASTSLISTIASFKDPLVIKRGECTKLSVFVNSGDLMNEKPGVDDLLQINLVKLYEFSNNYRAKNNVQSNVPVLAHALKY